MTAAQKHQEIQRAQALATAIYYKYVFEGIRYKTIGAHYDAIKANEKRQELAKELLQILGQLENKYLLKTARASGKLKYMQFTINRR